jgi:hypothetical protein
MCYFFNPKVSSLPEVYSVLAVNGPDHQNYNYRMCNAYGVESGICLL